MSPFITHHPATRDRGLSVVVIGLPERGGGCQFDFWAVFWFFDFFFSFFGVIHEGHEGALRLALGDEDAEARADVVDAVGAVFEGDDGDEEAVDAAH